MKHIHTEGIILHKKPYGEGHEFVFIFSKAIGKIKTKARGSRKIKSKFLGHLETLNICKLQIYRGPHNMLLTECEAITPFRYENLSSEHTEYALKLAEILDKSILEEEEDYKLYELIESSIKDLQTTEKPFISFLKTITKLTEILGHFTDFANTCPSCLKILDENEKSYFTEREEIGCNKCINYSVDSNNIDAKYRKFLSYLSKLNDREQQKLKINTEEQRILNRLSNAFLQSVKHN